jgi:hypothetical protein
VVLVALALREENDEDDDGDQRRPHKIRPAIHSEAHMHIFLNAISSSLWSK